MARLGFASAVWIGMFVAVGGATSGPQDPIDVATASPRVTAALTRANEAIQEMQTTLLGRLTTELGRGGPPAALTVCRTEATTLTSRVSGARGVALGRTSHRLRNPANAPRSWAAATVAAGEGRKVAELSPVVFNLGDRIGVLRPIGTLDFCLNCHGPADTVRATLGTALTSAYPSDRATGFAVGDLRGWAWAEVPLD